MCKGETIMNIIKEKRIEKGLSAKEVAEYLDISVFTYLKAEENYKDINVYLCMRISNIIGIEFDEITNTYNQ